MMGHGLAKGQGGHQGGKVTSFTKQVVIVDDKSEEHRVHGVCAGTAAARPTQIWRGCLALAAWCLLLPH